MRGVFLTAASVAALTAQGAAAQTATPPDDDVQLQAGEIVVTAQKRSQRLNDVGISIVAASAEQLNSAGITDVASMAKLVSGFTAAKSTYGFQVFSIRGIGFNSNQASATPTVSSYIDEAALPYTSMTAGLLLDVERVEVLKGPQGTLFGQNATGGSVNVIAAKPTADPEAGMQVSVDHFGGVELQGHISGPLSDAVRARLAFSTNQFGEWQKGYFANDDKHGDQNRGAARLLLDWQASDRLKLSFNVNGNYDHGDSQLLQLQQSAPQNPAGEQPALANYPLPGSARDAEANDKKRNRNSLFQAVGRADYELNDELTLTSITNFVTNKNGTLVDTDATTFVGGAVDAKSKLRSFNQEVRLTGEIPSQNINYILGASYQKDKIDEDLFSVVNNSSSLPPVTFNTVFTGTNRAAAVFGNIDWEVVDNLTLTGGVRYTATRQTTEGCTRDTGDGSWAGFLTGIADFARSLQGLGSITPIAPGACASLDDTPSLPGGLATFEPIRLSKAQKEDNVSWRVGINYKVTPDTLLYGLVSRGYKSGGYPVYDVVVASQSNAVTQEELTAYEVGIKTDLLDRRLSLSAAAFYYDYRDKQFFTFGNVPPLGVVSTEENIPKSKAKGVEADIQMRPFEGLTARTSLTYIHTKIGNYQGRDITTAVVDFKGNSFNFAPDWSGTFDIEYRSNIGDGLQGYLGGNALYNSKTYADLANSPNSQIDAYTIYDARLGVESDNGWYSSLWVRNLTDKYYWSSVGVGSDIIWRYAGRPRTFGATFGVNF